MQRRSFVAGAAGLAALPLAAFMLPEAKGAQAPWLPGTAAPARGLPSRAHVVGVMRRVNDHWIGTHGVPRTNDWAHATYHSGNMALYRLTGERRYLSHTTRWAEAFDYRLLRDGSPRFADHQCAGQVYLDLHAIHRDPAMISDTEASVRAMAGTDVTDWDWVDALHMAMPVWARLGRLRDDPSLYADLARRYTHTRDAEGGGLYDPATGLWWRDQRFIPPTRTRLGGTRMVVWSRGNGWALGGTGQDAPDPAVRRAPGRHLPGGLPADEPGARGGPAAGRVLEPEPGRPGPPRWSGDQRDGLLHLRHGLGRARRPPAAQRVPPRHRPGLAGHGLHGGPPERLPRLRAARGRPARAGPAPLDDGFRRRRLPAGGHGGRPPGPLSLAPPAAAAERIAELPPVGSLFAAFLGYNPMESLLGPQVLGRLPPHQAAHLTGTSFFPGLIAGPFSDGLRIAFTAAAVLCLVAAVASWRIGRDYTHAENLAVQPEAA